MNEREDGPSLGHTQAQSTSDPGPGRWLGGWWAETGLLLIGRVGHGGGDEDGEVGRRHPMLDLQPFGRALALGVMDLVVHPVAEEDLLITGQSHQGVVYRHSDN